MTNKKTNVKKIDKDEAAKRAKGYYGDFATETRIAYSSFLDGCDWKEQQMIDKACSWLSLNACIFGFFKEIKLQKMVNEFARAMKGGEE